MKTFFISDNADTFMGLKIAGITGVILHGKSQVLSEIERIKKNKEIGLIIITEKIGMMIPEEIKDMKLSKRGPLVVEIPDRHGTMKGENSIVNYVRESIGLKI